jgi:hypothetical protein
LAAGAGGGSKKLYAARTAAITKASPELTSLLSHRSPFHSTIVDIGFQHQIFMVSFNMGKRRIVMSL